MKYRILALFLAVSMLMTGCGMMGNSYVSITPYQQQSDVNQSEAISARN